MLFGSKLILTGGRGGLWIDREVTTAARSPAWVSPVPVISYVKYLNCSSQVDLTVHVVHKEVEERLGSFALREGEFFGRSQKSGLYSFRSRPFWKIAPQKSSSTLF